MRILFLGNNWVGWQILQWLREQQEDIVGLVLHPPGKRAYGQEMLKSAALGPRFVLDGTKLQDPECLAAVAALHPEIGISAFFGHILRPRLLACMPLGCVNIHPGLLPYNRGAYPNVWSIVEGTPAGVTLHYIDAGVDTGDIIAQREVPIEPSDTGETLYRRLEQACVAEFIEAWPSIRNGTAARASQSKGGTFHRQADVAAIDEIDLNKTYTARELLNIIRARTFRPYRGTYFVHEGQKIFLRLDLVTEDELSRGREA